MKFYISTAFRETKEAVEIAKAADDLGYDGVGIPDHIINLETLATPYPYTRDGERRWQPFTRLARSVGARRCDGSGDDAAEIRDDGVHPGDA